MPPAHPHDRLTTLLAAAARQEGDDAWSRLLEQEVEPAVEDEVGVRPAGGTTAGAEGGRHRGRRDGPRLLTLPVALRQARVGVRPVAAAGLVVVVMLVVVVLGARWWLTAQDARPQPLPPEGAPTHLAGAASAAPAPHAPAPTDVPVTGAGPAAPVGARQTGSTPATPSLVVVHVDGQVATPGVVEVPFGARVVDAVEAAGGLSAGADVSRLNLARPLQDGERIWVPAPGEQEPEVLGGSPTVEGGAMPGGGGGEPAETVVDLNAADQAALEELPGVGPATAGAILAWRDEHGRFSTVEELLEVSGIGEKTLERLRPHVVVR